MSKRHFFNGMLITRKTGKKTIGFGANIFQNKMRSLSIAYANLRPDTEAARAMSNDIEGIQKLADMMAKAYNEVSDGTATTEAAVAQKVLADYEGGHRSFPVAEDVVRDFAEQYKAQQSDVRFSLREGARADVEKALQDTSYRNLVRLTDDSPLIITSQKGARDLPMLMKPSHIRENIYTEEEAEQLGLPIGKDHHYHGLGETRFLDVIDNLRDVKEGYRGTKSATNPSRRENYFLLVSQIKDANGNTINVPVYINKKGTYNEVVIDTNKIATVFGRDNFQEWLRKQIDDGDLVRVKIKNTQSGDRPALIADGYATDVSYGDNRNTSEAKSQEEISKNSVEQIISSDNPDIRFSEADRGDAYADIREQLAEANRKLDLSSRELLSSALETVVENDAERKVLDRYRARVEKLNAMQTELNDVRNMAIHTEKDVI